MDFFNGGFSSADSISTESDVGIVMEIFHASLAVSTDILSMAQIQTCATLSFILNMENLVFTHYFFCSSKLTHDVYMNLNVNAAIFFQNHGCYVVPLPALVDLFPFPPYTVSYG